MLPTKLIKFLLPLFLLPITFINPKTARSQNAEGNFNCEWTGIECHANISTATCTPGYEPDDSACVDITDMPTCQGTIGNVCVSGEEPPPDLALCYACINGSCTLVDPVNYGACPYQDSDTGLYSCSLGCAPTAEITPPPGITPITGQVRFGCNNNSCEVDMNGEYTSAQACEADCAFVSNNECKGTCQSLTSLCGGKIPTGMCPNSLDLCCEDLFSIIGGDAKRGPEPVNCGGGNGFETAIGCIPVDSSMGSATFFIKWGMGIAGGAALAMMGAAGYLMSIAAGDPKKVQAAKELFEAAVMGIVLLLFGVFGLRFIGIEILGLGNLGFGN